MNLKSDSKIKPNITFLKCFAIISVIIAHINNDPKASSYLFFESISILGVPIFFFLLGFQSNKKTIIHKREFYISWIFWSSVVYLITSLSGVDRSNFTILKWFSYVLGYHSIFYFNSIYIILTIINRRIVTNIKFIICIVIINIVSLIFNIHKINIYFMGYLNPIFWVSFVLYGKLIHLVFEKDIDFLKSKISIILLTFISVFFFIMRKSNEYAYFDIFNYFFIFYIIFYINIVSSFLKFRRNLFEKNTLFIYLTHLPFAGLLSRFYILNYPITIITRLIVILSMYLIFIEIYKILIRRNNKNNNEYVLFRYLGLRK